MPTQDILSVSQVTAYIKSLFLMDPLLPDVWVTGEVSNFKAAASGHCYLTLKDGDASLKAVIWRTAARQMTLPRDGDAVTAHGYISVYERDGIYQLYIDRLEAAGAGRLWQAFEQLRGRLAAEGLFDEARKRAIPPRPGRIGIVTSSTAAALRDILRTLAARYPLVDVVLAPAAVQGLEAPQSIVLSLAALNRWSAERERLDVIIVARGGGSIEELWAFNDERVARAIAGSAVPVVTGIGHETDFTIADFAADLRAPTPTAAAGACSPDQRELRSALGALLARGLATTAGRLEGMTVAVAALEARAALASPQRGIARDRQRLDDLARRGGLATAAALRNRRAHLQGLARQVAALDPNRVLARGYAIVTRGDALVSSARQVAAGDPINVRVADGAFDATVQG